MLNKIKVTLISIILLFASIACSDNEFVLLNKKIEIDIVIPFKPNIVMTSTKLASINVTSNLNNQNEFNLSIERDKQHLQAALPKWLTVRLLRTQTVCKANNVHEGQIEITVDWQHFNNESKQLEFFIPVKVTNYRAFSDTALIKVKLIENYNNFNNNEQT